MNKLSGVLLYVCVNRPAPSYQEPGTPKKPDEWKASVAITDKSVIKEFKKYAQSIDAAVSIKEVDTVDFEELYKVAPPEDAGDEIWVVTFRKSTELGKTGKPVPDLYKPKVFEKVGKTLVDVTNSKLPGNGSLGTISTEVFTRKNNTSSIYLKNVLVTDMIEYVPAESGEDYEPGSEFDDDTDAAPAKAPAKAKAPAAAPKAKAKAKPAVEEADDDSDPF